MQLPLLIALHLPLIVIEEGLSLFTIKIKLSNSTSDPNAGLFWEGLKMIL